MTRTSRLTAAATALVLAATGPLHAQSATGQDSMESAVPDPLLTAFVTAALEVDAVAQAYQPRMEAAQDEGARATVGEEAQMAMIAAIEETDGITVEEYLAIAQAARTDQALNDRVIERYEELSTEE